MNDDQHQQRGRTLSAGDNNAHLNSSASASASATSTSPHHRPSLDNSYRQQPPQQSFDSNSNPQLDTFSAQFGTDFPQQGAQYLDPQATLLDFCASNYQTSSQSFDLPQQTFMQSQASLPPQNNINTAPYLHHTQSYTSDHLSPGSSSINLGSNSPFSTTSDTTSFPGFDPGLDIDTSIQDPLQVFGNQSQQQSLQQQSFDPSSLSLDPMAATLSHGATPPPHMLRPGMRRSSQSPSPHHSPSFQQNSFNDQIARPRAESLDPASAAYPPQGYRGNDWAMGHSFQTHRRTPSDTYSDVSSHSVQASPYLAALDTFDDASPMLNAQDPALYTDVLNMHGFTLSDPQLNQSHISPAHSPRVSPNLMPQHSQQPLPDYTPLNNFGFSPDMATQNVSTFEPFPNIASEPFPTLSTANSPGDFGQADIMSPPEINIDFAPPSRQPSFGPPGAVNGQEDTLSPPDRSKSTGMTRDNPSSR